MGRQRGTAGAQIIPMRIEDVFEWAKRYLTLAMPPSSKFGSGYRQSATENFCLAFSPPTGKLLVLPRNFDFSGGAGTNSLSSRASGSARLQGTARACGAESRRGDGVRRRRREAFTDAGPRTSGAQHSSDPPQFQHPPASRSSQFSDDDRSTKAVVSSSNKRRDPASAFARAA